MRGGRVASIVATVGAGLSAGSVSRRKGGFVAALAAAPSTLLWTSVTVGGWSGHLPFLSDRFEMDFSISCPTKWRTTCCAKKPSELQDLVDFFAEVLTTIGGRDENINRVIYQWTRSLVAADRGSPIRDRVS